MRKITGFLIMFTTLAAYSQDRLTGQLFAIRSEVIAKHGMACTSQPLATQLYRHLLPKTVIPL
jgi:gamma-glutamyltranspeptidase/glutathione hydrolase